MRILNRKMYALLATGRVANVPSVVSNVWLGVVLSWVHRAEFGGEVPWLQVGFLILAGVCLYLAGNFLNDWMDHDWDVVNRPERALPSGVFKPEMYARLALCLGVVGVLAAILVSRVSGLVAVGICVFVVIYTFWHKRSPWAVVPMGLCRAMLPVLGGSPFLGSAGWAWVSGLGIFFYISGLSLSARYESQAEPPRWAVGVSRGLLLAPVFFLVSCGNRVGGLGWLAWLGVLPFSGWMVLCLTRYRRPISRHVSSLLAGIPLMDWVVLLPLSLVLGWGVLGVLCFAVPVVAFISALLLQRLAPAT